MTITHTNGIQKVTFTWNDDLTHCDYIGQGVEDETIEKMVAMDCHEGNDFDGFDMSIDL